MEKIDRPLKFAVVGMLNTTVDFTLFWVLEKVVGLPILGANTISYSAGMINSFLWNKFWTFGDISQVIPLTQQFPRFVFFNLVALAISNALVGGLCYALPVLPSKALSILGVLFWNYWISRRSVYSGSENS